MKQHFQYTLSGRTNDSKLQLRPQIVAGVILYEIRGELAIAEISIMTSAPLFQLA